MSLSEDIPEVQISDEQPPLFTAGENWQSRACLNYLDDQWDIYALGFKRAADIVVERLLLNDLFIDSLVFPVAFNYRQYLELRIKEILKGVHYLNDIPDCVLHTHDLRALWRIAINQIIIAFPSEDSSQLDIVDTAVNEFSSIDSGSFSFRHPTDKDNNPSLPGIKYINILDLKKGIDNVESLLEGISALTSVHIEHKKDMHTEFASFEDY